MSNTIGEIRNIVQGNNIKGKIEFNYNLSRLSWFGIAGNAEVFYIPQSEQELSLLLKLLPPEINRTVIGMGSNILIRDGGIDGIVIKLGKEFSNIKLEKDFINVGASTLDKILSKFCASHSICGFEFLSGIPGNIGGAIAMNAGCYNSEVKDIFLSADCLDYSGNKATINASDNLFSYRNNSKVHNLIVINAKFKMKKGITEQIGERMDMINKNRILSQPQKVRTAGSTFKNPILGANKKAWELIEISDSRNIITKDISLSKKHANFIVNKQFNSANQIEDFGESIKERVLGSTGVLLEWEIKRIGNK